LLLVELGLLAGLDEIAGLVAVVLRWGRTDGLTVGLEVATGCPLLVGRLEGLGLTVGDAGGLV
jgi:hypothetical protein